MPHFIKVTIFEEQTENWGRFSIDQSVSTYILKSAHEIDMDAVTKKAERNVRQDGGDGKSMPFSSSYTVSVEEWVRIGEREFAEAIAKAEQPDACFFDDRIVVVDLDTRIAIEHFGANFALPDGQVQVEVPNPHF